MLRRFNLPFLLVLLSLVLGSGVVHAALPMMTLQAEQLVQPVDVPASLILEDPSGNLTAGEVQQLIEQQGRLSQ